jgi:hypothetical protein
MFAQGLQYLKCYRSNITYILIKVSGLADFFLRSGGPKNHVSNYECKIVWEWQGCSNFDDADFKLIWMFGCCYYASDNDFPSG